MSSANGKISTSSDVEQTLLRPDISFEDSQTIYLKWAEDGTYDELHEEQHQMHTGQVMMADIMGSLFSDKTNVRLLDAGAGTGLAGAKVGMMLCALLELSVQVPSPPSGFWEFIRVTKKGGYIINCMREEFLWTVPQ
ncbi:hypothetical protein ElyMa_000686200 [Elysia marginata]|uniref:Uncharacterized protein n=1 Tax=Elysia marginata TaxID=1093978 RepID=A0AAV4GHS8_9GAST|nr:hypothetical protein ElyMa_000686200 [Elysia marginata]